jgi:Fungal Zn(2)-Cys(6) binuclear cluster domain
MYDDSPDDEEDDDDQNSEPSSVGHHNRTGHDSTPSNLPNVLLCASCDRCRARKAKCDGKRPCSNCANRYLKKHGMAR